MFKTTVSQFRNPITMSFSLKDGYQQMIRDTFQGIERLYRHQEEAIRSIRQGKCGRYHCGTQATCNNCGFMLFLISKDNPPQGLAKERSAVILL